MPNTHKNLLLVALFSILLLTAGGAAKAAPGDVLFSDNFEDGTLANWTTSNAARSGVSNAGGFAGSGAFGAFTRNDPVSVTSPSINAAVPAATLTLWVRRGADSFSEDTDANEDFVIEYRDAGGSWIPLITYFGSGTNGQVYNPSFFLPAAALHGNLAIRMRQTEGSGVDFDYWHWDDVVVTEAAPSGGFGVGSCDDFESGLGAHWTLNEVTGFSGVSSATAQSPANSLFLNGGLVEVESVDIDTDDITFEAVSVWIQRGSDTFSEDPDGGEDLTLEYRNDTGAWIALETFSGAGAPGQVFTRTYTLPASARHTAFRLRFRLAAGSGAPWDYWHVDDVCLDQNPDPILEISKTQSLLTDPVGGPSGPLAIPGAVVEYTVNVINRGIGSVDANTLDLSDVVPLGAELYVSTVSGDPVVFADGSPSSGLSYNYASDVTFTDNPGGIGPYDYTASPDADGYDPLITGFQITPGGSMVGDSGSGPASFDIVFRVRIE